MANLTKQTAMADNPTDDGKQGGGEGMSGGARSSRDFIPWQLLLVVLLLVEVSVLWLMYPRWQTEKDRFFSIHHMKKGNYEAAAKRLETLLVKKPTSPTYLSELGYTYYHRKNYDQAIEFFNRAEENKAADSPSDDTVIEITDFNNMIGVCYYKKGDYANAEKHLLEALKINKTDPLAAFTLGEIEFNRKNYRKASSYFKIVADLPQYSTKVKDYYGKMEKALFAGI